MNRLLLVGFCGALLSAASVLSCGRGYSGGGGQTQTLFVYPVPFYYPGNYPQVSNSGQGAQPNSGQGTAGGLNGQTNTGRVRRFAKKTTNEHGNNEEENGSQHDSMNTGHGGNEGGQPGSCRPPHGSPPPKKDNSKSGKTIVNQEKTESSDKKKNEEGVGNSDKSPRENSYEQKYLRFKRSVLDKTEKKNEKKKYSEQELKEKEACQSSESKETCGKEESKVKEMKKSDIEHICEEASTVEKGKKETEPDKKDEKVEASECKQQEECDCEKCNKEKKYHHDEESKKCKRQKKY